MRIPVMWRTGAVATTMAALVAVSGCTVQAVGTPAEGTTGGLTPTGQTPAGQTPAGKTPAGTASTPGASPDDAKPSKPKPAAPPAPAPRTLWSKGDRGRDVRELQARLRQVSWLFEGPTGAYEGSTATAVKGFQGKRGLPKTGRTDTVTWQRLLNMTREPGKWELYASGGQPAATPDPRCMTGRVLCVSKTSRTLRWMIDGRTVSTMDVRFGSQYTPTREGVFNVYFKSRHHVSTIYDSPMPYAMFFSGGQAVHYSSDFAATGYYGASHGCVNVRDEGKIAALFSQVRNGDKVVVYW
ncbi:MULTISPECIES: L,D-transpeptidase family protein [unclassified Streptomyces]|uniref:L,D-transpeptidase family protein n=1 Tax=unclassified Streptomyces TaxID=2593676 RepID=UPI00364B2378